MPSSVMVANRRQRLDRMGSKMREFGIDGAILFDWDNIRYATDFRWMPLLQSKAGSVYFSAVVFPDSSVTLLVAEMDYARAKEDYGLDGVRMYSGGTSGLVRAVVQTLSEHGLSKGRATVDEEYVPVSVFKVLRGAVDPQTDIISSTQLMSETRRVKFPHEIAALKKAVSLTDQCHSASIDLIKRGDRRPTEAEVSALAYHIALKEGSEGVVNAVVASGPNSGRVHYQDFASMRQIQSGEIVLMDYDIIWDGYCSDLTRTVCASDHPTREQQHAFDVVFEAEREAIKKVRAGQEAWRIDDAAREIVRGAGLEQYYDYNVWTVHGIGLSHTEEPVVTSRPDSRNQFKLEAGMVLSIEPGLYFDEYGLRIEDMVHVTESGCEVLSSLTPSL